MRVVSARLWMLSQKIRLVTRWHFSKNSHKINSVLVVVGGVLIM